MQDTCRLFRTESYWNTYEESPIFMPIQSAMSLIRLEQLKRYLKNFNPSTDKDFKGIDWYAKVELLYSDFVKASRAHLMPGRDVSLDEQLILFKGCSKYTILIPTKRTEKDFKIYSLCYENYMINFMFSSKASNISGLKKLSGFTDSSSIVIKLCKSLPNYGEPNMVVLYTDNFFTNVKLFQYLQKRAMGAFGTTKE